MTLSIMGLNIMTLSKGLDCNSWLSVVLLNVGAPRLTTVRRDANGEKEKNVFKNDKNKFFK
jgi:hypothetical protein